MGRDQEQQGFAFSLYPLYFFLYCPFKELIFIYDYEFLIFQFYCNWHRDLVDHVLSHSASGPYWCVICIRILNRYVFINFIFPNHLIDKIRQKNKQDQTDKQTRSDRQKGKIRQTNRQDNDRQIDKITIDEDEIRQKNRQDQTDTLTRSNRKIDKIRSTKRRNQIEK